MSADVDGHSVDIPPPPPNVDGKSFEEVQAIECILMRYPDVEEKAKAAVRELSFAQAMQLLKEFEEKGSSIRKPSAFLLAAALGTKEREQPQQFMSGPQMAELDRRLRRHDLNDKAKALIRALSHRAATKILNELESRSDSIRNASAYVISASRTAKERDERRRHHSRPDGRDREEDENEVVELINHYEALEIEDQNADESTIKKAYRKLVLKWHPDKHPTDREEAEERIRQINEAYEVLSNPTKRSQYDQQRRAVQRKKEGKTVHTTTLEKVRIPKECMLQPIGFPDKFVRYVDGGKRGSQVVVQSRADAKKGSTDNMLEEFMPFFKAAKFSFWWIPEVNAMARIRAVEAGTERFGEALRANQAGGLNLAFRIRTDEDDADAAVFLLDARKGEKKELVNFLVLPSPIYDGAYRFEAAYRQGYLLSFLPPCSLRMLPHNEAGNAVVDFTLINFAAMFKFIEIEEVLRPVCQGRTDWLPLAHFKADTSVLTYFRDILERPMWDDEDFMMYFEGHFDTWDFNRDGMMVRLRGSGERLSLDLQAANDPGTMASKIAESSQDGLMRLPWRIAMKAFEVLSQPSGDDELSLLVKRMEANRKLISALGGILTTAQGAAERPPLSAIVGLAEKVKNAKGDPGVEKLRDEAFSSLTKLAVVHIKAADKDDAELGLEVADLVPLLALPEAAEESLALVRIMSPDFASTPVPTLLQVVSAAVKSGEEKAKSLGLTAGIAALALAQHGSSYDLGQTVKTLVEGDFQVDECAAALVQRAQGMDGHDLGIAVAALGAKGIDNEDVRDCAYLLSTRPLILPSEVLLSLAVAGTKTEAVAAVLSGITDVVTATLKMFSAANVIRLLLALSKAKGDAIPVPKLRLLFKEAAAILKPQMEELPIVDIIKVALAAGGTSASDLLEVAACESEKRLKDMQPAHLMLLTQALLPLGGDHPTMRSIMSLWIEMFTDSDRAEKLQPDQFAKLSSLVAQVKSLDKKVEERYLEAIGPRIINVFSKMSSGSVDLLEKQMKGGDGLGRWKDKGKIARLIPENRKRSRSREKEKKERDQDDRRDRGDRDRDGGRDRDNGRRSRSRDRRSRSRDRDGGGRRDRRDRSGDRRDNSRGRERDKDRRDRDDDRRRGRDDDRDRRRR